jgi:phosphoglycolate phosphatase-like HAD superfamily hydrolase
MRSGGGIDVTGAFLLDFDHTLFDTDRFFWIDVRAAFAQFGIDGARWEESYARVWPSGYSLEKHLDYLTREGQVGVSVKAAQQVLREHFSDLRTYLFVDVEPFLKQLQAARVPCFLLSFGDPIWQAYKVRGARIADFFQDVFYTSKAQTKVEVVEPVVERFARLAVVDNDPRELDLIKARYPQIETFWITRVPPEVLQSFDVESRERFREARGYATISAAFTHHRCQTLSGVTL